MILLKFEKVEFLGAHPLQPIITIPELKVEGVLMSPCERYVITYSPSSKEKQFTVWDF
jgi:hypothetical protein